MMSPCRAGVRVALALLPALSATPAAAGKLRVVATTPDLADIARRVGGELVSVESLARGVEDIHQIVMKPSFVTRLNRADAVVFLGLSVEHSFLPGLLDAARNPRARADLTRACSGPACIDCSAGVAVLDKPPALSRAEGELHPQGNPHYNLDPANGPLIARNIAAGLSAVSPASAAEFERNLAAYAAELEGRLARWRALAAPLKGLKAVSYHKDVAYLARFTGIEFVDAVEPKPGVGPTPAHLARLAGTMKDGGVRLIVREQQYDARTCDWLAARTGARVAVIGTMAGALPGAVTFIEMTEANLKALLAAAVPAAGAGPGGP